MLDYERIRRELKVLAFVEEINKSFSLQFLARTKHFAVVIQNQPESWWINFSIAIGVPYPSEITRYAIGDWYKTYPQLLWKINARHRNNKIKRHHRVGKLHGEDLG